MIERVSSEVAYSDLVAGIVEVKNSLNADYDSLYLTGGTAVAAYAESVRRPLSADLDFFIPSTLCDRLQELYNAPFVTYSNKPLFKSQKLVTATSQGIDLDFIVVQNIVPNLEFPAASIKLFVDDFVVRNYTVSNFGGESYRLLPAEYILLAKLFAGRGLEVGKYDLRDCETLLQAEVVEVIRLKQLLEELPLDKFSRELVFRRIFDSLQKICVDNKIIKSYVKEIRARLRI